MKKRISINNNLYYVQQYNTETELKLLEFIELNNDLDDDDYRICSREFLKCVNININDISDTELIILLLKVRECTIGTELKLKISCPICKHQFSSTIDLTNIYKESKKDNFFDDNNFISKDHFNTLGDDTISEDMDWDEYEEVKSNLIDYYNIYDLDFKIKCPCCNSNISFSIDTVKKALSFMSEESVQSLMTVIHNLTYFDHISRADVLRMTPIERLIEISLLKKTKEALEQPIK